MGGRRDDPAGMRRAPVRRLAHARLRQVQTGRADARRQHGIVGYQQRREAAQALCQRQALFCVTRTYNDHAPARQPLRGARPVSLAVIGHQHQWHVRIEARLTPC